MHPNLHFEGEDGPEYGHSSEDWVELSGGKEPFIANDER